MLSSTVIVDRTCILGGKAESVYIVNFGVIQIVRSRSAMCRSLPPVMNFSASASEKADPQI